MSHLETWKHLGHKNRERSNVSLSHPKLPLTHRCRIYGYRSGGWESLKLHVLGWLCQRTEGGGGWSLWLVSNERQRYHFCKRKKTLHIHIRKRITESNHSFCVRSHRRGSAASTTSLWQRRVRNQALSKPEDHGSLAVREHAKKHKVSWNIAKFWS